MLATTLGAVGLGLTACVCLGAAWRGGKPERRAAPLAALSAGATFAVQSAAPWVAAHFGGTWTAAAVVATVLPDIAAMTVLMRLTWRSGRVWPNYAVAAQGIALAIQLERLADPQLTPDVVLRALSLAHAGLLAALASGVVGAWRDKRQPSIEPSTSEESLSS